MKIPFNKHNLAGAVILFGSFYAVTVNAGSCSNAARYAPAHPHQHHAMPFYGYRAALPYQTPRYRHTQQRPFVYGRAAYPTPYAAATQTTAYSAAAVEENSNEQTSQASRIEIELPASGDIKLTIQGGDWILTDASGLSLYTYVQDPKNQSSCSGQCAVSWPPVAASDKISAVGDFTAVKRSDGSLQWAYKGQPLYTWAGDRKVGDTSGDGVGGVWNLARI